MSRASDAAYARLAEELEYTTPPCSGDDEFTADDLTKQQVSFLATICCVCPLRDPCHEYAEIAKPKAGVWAGKTYRTNKERSTEK